MSWSERHRNRSLTDRAIPWGNIDPTPEHAPTFTLDRQVAEARREMGEARWAELNAEWEQGK